MRLFNGQDSDGNGPEFDLQLPNHRKEAKYTLYVWGTIDGGTVQLQISPDGGNTWVDLDGASLTAVGATTVEFRATAVRANLSGSGSPDLNAMLL